MRMMRRISERCSIQAPRTRRATLPGGADTYTLPTIANGKVYVPTSTGLAVFGLFKNAPQAPPPVISSRGATFSAGQTVTFAGTEPITIGSSLPNTTIYYTTNGTVPTIYASHGTAPLRSFRYSERDPHPRSQARSTMF